MSRAPVVLQPSPDELAELTRRVNASSVAKRDCFRAQIVLACTKPAPQAQVATQLGTSKATVNKWSQRFAKSGLTGLSDAPGRGRKPSLPIAKVQQVISSVTQPPPERTRWTVRTMAKATGMSPSSVHRYWRRNDLKPHLTRTFKLSTDPRFEEKFWDVIGLYLDPPDKALVLCCDEKSQCQALERTQPGLPLGIGQIRTKTHDYKRHGTITLFAALNYLEGKLIARTEKQHTHVEWLRFLRQLDRNTPKDLDLHLIMDNYCTHKHKKVKAWLAKHPRFHCHFTPTGASWMNLVERFFGELTSAVIREGSFGSVAELVASIEAYLIKRNLNPKAYRWQAKGEDILRKIARARAKLEAMAALSTAEKKG